MTRRLTPEQQDAREDHEQQRYDQLMSEYEDAARDEYEQEFGPSPGYKPDGARLHEMVMQRMRRDAA